VTVLGEGEPDTINVSPVAKNLDNIQGTLIVNGGDGADTLNINDQSNPFGTSYTITSTAVTRSGAAAIYYRPKLPFGTSAMEAVYVNAGSGSDTISIQGTPSGTLVAVNGGSGNDAFNIGSSTNTLDALLGDLVLNGESGTDALTIRDQGTTIGKTYSLAYHWWGTLTRTGAGVINHALMESLAVNAGTGADTSNVHSTAAGTPVTVNGGGGNDIFNVGNPADSLDSILGTLTVNGQAGDDALNINDQGTATAKSYTVNPYSVTRSGAAAIKFQADFIVIGAPAWVETVVLNAGNGDDLIRVQGTVPGTSVTANAGGGTDKLDYSSYSSGVTVNLATGSATGLAAISGVENVTGGSGGDTLIGDAGSNILVGGNGRDRSSGALARTHSPAAPATTSSSADSTTPYQTL